MRGKSGRTHRFAESPVLQLALPAWRSRLVALILLASFAVLVGRSFYLQVVNNDFLQEKGESRYRRDLEISASRGKVTDRNGEVLAISTPMKSIWAIPVDAKLNSQQTRQLAKALEADPKELTRKLGQGLCLPPAAGFSGGGRPGGRAEAARHLSEQGVPSLLPDRRHDGAHGRFYRR
jgi:cell division protein FtsI (penicillin-binding protein 3)